MAREQEAKRSLSSRPMRVAACQDAVVASEFDDLVDEAANAPIEGWDFGWLEGRATEERPSWGYARLVAERVTTAASLLDLETGGGELLASVPHLPPCTVATEAWGPNVSRATARLQPRHVSVVAADGENLPFREGSYELVISRHPVATCWEEVARVLTPGGRYLSQQVGPRSMVELTEVFLGPQHLPPRREPEQAALRAGAAGLSVLDLRKARLRATFLDVGAVVYFLRLVIWIVPDFTVTRYRRRLLALHHQIQASGPFVAHATRFLIEAMKPG